MRLQNAARCRQFRLPHSCANIQIVLWAVMLAGWLVVVPGLRVGTIRQSHVYGWGAAMPRYSRDRSLALEMTTPKLPKPPRRGENIAPSQSQGLMQGHRQGHSPTPISAVKSRIAAVEAQIAEVAESIKGVQGQLVEVGATIHSTKVALEQIDAQDAKWDLQRLILVSLMDEKAKLMDKEAKLMDEKAKLMDKESGLMDEKLKLMDKENDMMDEKAKLMDKEAKLMDKEAKLMDKEAKLMDEKTKLAVREEQLIIERMQHSGSTSFSPTNVEGVELSIPDSFNFDVSSWEVGQSVDCSALSDAMRPFGGFPSCLLVREEMKAVWSIVCEGITENETKWVLVGSPGVGKSVLTVLLCFHLARSFNKAVFLARQLKGEEYTSQSSVALCIHPGGKALGYPKNAVRKIELTTVSGTLHASYPRVITVLDGWSQNELAITSVGQDYGGFNLLATSTQYRRKSQDVRYLVMLPAWLEADLKSLRNLCGLSNKDNSTFEGKLYYSGGSAREFLRPIEDVRGRIDDAIASISMESCKNILAGYGGSPGAPHDTLRRSYLSERSVKSYRTSSKWIYAIDSAYALRRLSALAPLKVYLQSLAIAKGASSPSLYGQMFEVFVHQLFSTPKMSATFHVRDANLSSSAVGGYDAEFRLSDIASECVGGTPKEAMAYLGSRVMDVTRATYWCPDFPRFPSIDAIACDPSIKTVLYIQLTVGKEKVAKQRELSDIHNLVKSSLKSTLLSNGGNISNWTFWYVVIEPSSQEADALDLKATEGFMLGEVKLGKGYVAYSAELSDAA